MTANPTLLSMPLAQNGQKNVIPETQATAGDGLFSQSTGFPSETSLPLGAGGVAPSREDFNGMANLLGGVAFMAQKGFTFNYDATQDYYVGCVVIDPTDGNRYLCIADMPAGTVAPSADTTHDYWIFYPVGVINKRDVVTTSGTYTAPVTGWYRITVKGGGGGGGGGFASASYPAYGMAGGGGGEGGITIAFERMAAGQTASVIIGAGGAGGTGSTSSVGSNGVNGGDSSVTVNSNTYTGGGGGGGTGYRFGGDGGSGTITGARGLPVLIAAWTSAGGNAQASTEVGTGHGIGGRGGLAAIGSTAGAENGTAGGDGCAVFEYFAEV